MVEKSIPIGLLRWRCRRGTKELDRILGGFLEEDYTQASAELQRSFAALLERQDPDIYDWLMGVEQPDEIRFEAIVGALQRKYCVTSS